MKRIFEALAHACVFAPQEVAAATEKTTTFVDASGVSEVEFLLSTAALGAGKKVKIELLSSASPDGTGAKAIGEGELVDAVGTAPAMAVISYRPVAENGRYVGVKFQHDGAAAVACGVTASAMGGFLPAANGWTLVV